jgi:CheY-like chemotaxis protein
MASVGTLAGGVAHEINNPLAFLIANLEFIAGSMRELLAKTPDEEMKELAAAVSDSAHGAQRIRRIVADLKTLSRGDDFAAGPIEVRRALDLSLSMAMNEIRHRARLVTKWDPMPEVHANESRLGQVFLNLLMNAAQAIPVGRASENEIRVSTGTDSGGRAVVEISDTGCGIPEGARARIFEPFFTTKPIGQGTGLGLSISHGIVQSFGGSISLESVPGQGTTFRVCLPPSAAQSDRGLEAAAPVHASPQRRILIVDDELALARSLGRNLKEHQVEAVGSGREALAALTRDPRFDVILCDLMMPEMTGVELYEEIQRVAPQLAARVVFMTGGVFSADVEAFLERVAPKVLDKPIELSTLRSLMSGDAADAKP